MRYRRLPGYALALAFVALAPRLTAQCPNGAPPPCAQAATPRPDPPLDDKRWIVLPFTNVAHAADLDWLSSASVKLLSVDMSRWTDVRVVDDERVADLLREVSEAGRTQLGLQTGLSIAKRAGAGMLVMGDYLKEGTRASVTAKVYNVRTGNRIRLVEQPSVPTDSISASYRRLTPRVLALALPPGTTLSGIGTSSTNAIRAYTLGLRAFNRSRTDSALTYFVQAVAFDSTFALAHFRVATLARWAIVAAVYPGGELRARATAQRLAASLPERERLVIGWPALTNCEKGRRLLAADSADAEGWLATGECNLRDSTLIVNPDGTVRLRGSYETARKAYERVLGLQPSKFAITGLQNMMALPLRQACSVSVVPCPPDRRYHAPVIYRGDTLATPFEPVSTFDTPLRRSDVVPGLRAREERAKDMFGHWAAAYPEDLVAQATYGDFLRRVGQLDAARRSLDAAAELAQLVQDLNRGVYNFQRAELDWSRVEVEWQSGRVQRAAAIIDSLPTTAAARSIAIPIAFARFSRGLAPRDSASRSLWAVFNVVNAGVVPPDFDESTAALAGALGPLFTDVANALAFHARRSRPVADTASEFSLFRFQALLTRRDTLRARRALAEYDAWGRERADEHWDAYEMFAAESWLELGDTTTAWARIAPFAERFPRFWGLTRSGAFGQLAACVTGRAWLLYADLAIATGRRAEAKRGYEMVVAMWEKGDAPVQPLVKRAKEALMKLGA